MESLSMEEIDALIVDRHGQRVYIRRVDGEDTFFLKREGVEVRPADYSSNEEYLDGELAAGAIPDDPTGREMYEAAITSAGSAKEMALAFLNAFVPDPHGRLELIRRRGPEG